MPTIQEILRTAKEAGASDVHLTVGIPPKMRVNGKLVAMDYPTMYPSDTLDVIINIMSEVQRERLEECGEYDMSYAITNLGRYRVNAYKQRGSVALAFRLVDTRIPVAEELGIPASVIELYRKRRGLVLVTGPTGSGKSTTLAALIDKINCNREAHVITLEDPIEYLHQHKMSMVNQREIGIDTDNYANALRASLREDPDVILVGEMRDFETISVALTAAETGHLVLSSLHTGGAASTINRIIDLVPQQHQRRIRVQLANVLRAVVSQQLIPTINGKGRVAAFEVMHANSEVRDLIREGELQQLNNIIQTGSEQGMITMDEAIYRLCSEGKIAGEMAIQFAHNPELMETRITEI